MLVCLSEFYQVKFELTLLTRWPVVLRVGDSQMSPLKGQTSRS